MSAFTENNMPAVGGSAMSVQAVLKYEAAYNAMLNDLSDHEKKISESHDPHGTKTYVDTVLKPVKDNAIAAKNIAKRLESFVVGDITNENYGKRLEDYVSKKLGKDLAIIDVIATLMDRVEALEKENHILSLLQFDNVPVGAGIRWWKDELPEDGTYVWANGQTLYGVNQNFPELARVWKLGSADNVKVPKEDHTIFKVRKATKRIEAIQHAYIDVAAGEGHPEEGE